MADGQEDDAAFRASEGVDHAVVADAQPKQPAEERIVHGDQRCPEIRAGLEHPDLLPEPPLDRAVSEFPNSREKFSVKTSSHAVEVRPSASQVLVTAEELGLRQHARPPKVLEPATDRFQLRAVGQGVHRFEKAFPQRSGNLHDIPGGTSHDGQMRSLLLQLDDE